MVLVWLQGKKVITFLVKILSILAEVLNNLLFFSWKIWRVSMNKRLKNLLNSMKTESRLWKRSGINPPISPLPIQFPTEVTLPTFWHNPTQYQPHRPTPPQLLTLLIITKILPTTWCRNNGINLVKILLFRKRLISDVKGFMVKGWIWKICKRKVRVEIKDILTKPKTVILKLMLGNIVNMIMERVTVINIVRLKRIFPWGRLNR